MARVGLGAISRLPVRTRGLLLVATGLLVVLLFDGVFPAQPPNWRPATVAFCGFTNLPGGMCAVLTLENQTATRLKLRNIGYMEFYRIPVNNSFNRFRSYATGTNFVLRSGQPRYLLLPVSEEGSGWSVHLVFSPTGLQAELAESLQKIRSSWVELLPKGIRTVRSMSMVLFLHREDSLNTTANSVDRP